MPNTPGNWPLINNPHAHDIFVDGTAGIHLFDGIARITLEAVHVDHSSNPPTTSRVVTGRLVMSISAAERMAKSILAFIEQARSSTQTPTAPAGSPLQ